MAPIACLVTSITFLFATAGNRRTHLYQDEWVLADEENVKVKGTPVSFWFL
jgi:hypothetical protein